MDGARDPVEILAEAIRLGGGDHLSPCFHNARRYVEALTELGYHLVPDPKNGMDPEELLMVGAVLALTEFAKVAVGDTVAVPVAMLVNLRELVAWRLARAGWGADELARYGLVVS